MKETGADVMGRDWRIPLDEGWARLDHAYAVQGNRPHSYFLLTEGIKVARGRHSPSSRGGGTSRPHLQSRHGTAETPVDNVKTLGRFVQEYSGRSS